MIEYANKDKSVGYSLPAEWEEQDAVQLTWPHAESDWAYMLDEVEACFVQIATEILMRQNLLVICPSEPELRKLLPSEYAERLRCVELPSNDTWARDHAGLALLDERNGGKALADFCFNGWGMKFAANYDNLLTESLYRSGVFADDVKLLNLRQFVLEGGAVESDGQGTVLSTASCLFEPNRNAGIPDERLPYLAQALGAERLLILEHGALMGDDTDGHIDTLARFCSADTIAYVRCDDTCDVHYYSLLAMEKELQELRQANGEPYKLLPLPMAPEVYEEGERLPATYANFLIINGAVLMPSYQAPTDALAAEQLAKAFPDREICQIDCLPLIKQHGSLHCVTMQYPKGFLKPF